MSQGFAQGRTAFGRGGGSGQLLRDQAGRPDGTGWPGNVPTLQEGPGTLIGRYKLLQQIGEGGCGTVFMAEQEEPVRRRWR